MVEIYYVLTRNCNLKCPHCYMSAGPGQEDHTMSGEDFRKTLDHLPSQRTHVTLSGGEIFTVPDHLDEYLNHLSDFNRERKGNVNITIQTNGLWARDEGTAKAIMDYLIEKGVGDLRVAAADDYHINNGGLSSDQLRRLNGIGMNKGVWVSVSGATQSLMPIGRAAELIDVNEANFHYDPGIQCKMGIHNNWFTVNPEGKVFSCCYQMFSHPGNLIEEPLEDILKKSRENPRTHELDCKGIRGIAEYDGFDPLDISVMIKKYGDCGTCAILYGPDKSLSKTKKTL
jgi:hypothetical protein